MAAYFDHYKMYVNSGVIDGEPLRFRGEVYHGYHFTCATCSVELDHTAREVKHRPGYAANDVVSTTFMYPHNLTANCQVYAYNSPYFFTLSYRAVAIVSVFKNLGYTVPILPISNNTALLCFGLNGGASAIIDTRFNLVSH